MRALGKRIAALGSSAGMGLAEVLVAAGIGVLLISVLPPFYNMSVRMWQREAARLGAVGEADFSVRRVRQDIRNARKVLVSSDGRSLTLALPKRSYDPTAGRIVNELDATGHLLDGDHVVYYFSPEPESAGQGGGALYRRVVKADGTEEPPQVVAGEIYPGLNPVVEGTSHPRPLFAYDGSRRVVTVTVTAAEVKPSTGAFSATVPDARCGRDHGELVRVPTSEHPEGEIHCVVCGSNARPTAEIVSYRTELMPRNL